MMFFLCCFPTILYNVYAVNTKSNPACAAGQACRICLYSDLNYLTILRRPKGWDHLALRNSSHHSFLRCRW